MDDQTLHSLADTAALLAFCGVLAIAAWLVLALALALFVGRGIALCSARDEIRQRSSRPPARVVGRVTTRPTARFATLAPPQIGDAHHQACIPDLSNDPAGEPQAVHCYREFTAPDAVTPSRSRAGTDSS
ncbi:hypothetical protein [Subtercola frigoramans]|uniref:Uncharacterized protein n=1 Tax=Subtercola frigoramans TaxID=120298 RepID=A0ABS2L8M6_9MICO|nr:hypothetical protein [Subtercola frigoramans]MBM7473447.1 hypothetical protein [Subtercola frigoramans]